MNILIGDIGNTLTKICLVDIKTLKQKKVFFFNSRNLLLKNFIVQNFKKFVKNKSINKFSLFSSVVPKYESILKKELNRLYKTNLIEINHRKINKIVKINIKNKNEVGSDRIANAVGAYKKYKKNCIILDFGTATTFDIITRNGSYNGGVIAPGVSHSIKSLFINADQIPLFKLKKPQKVVGENTIEALCSGFYWGYSGLINNIILKIEKETKKKYKIVLTGGYAELFKKSFVKPVDIDKNITINGIIEIFKINKKKLS